MRAERTRAREGSACAVLSAHCCSAALLRALESPRRSVESVWFLPSVAGVVRLAVVIVVVEVMLLQCLVVNTRYLCTLFNSYLRYTMKSDEALTNYYR